LPRGWPEPAARVDACSLTEHHQTGTLLTGSAHDDTVAAALETARALGLYVILRLHTLIESRLTVVDGRLDRRRGSRLGGVGVHAFTADGAVGFASVDDLRPAAASEAVKRAGALAEAARLAGARPTTVAFALESQGRIRVPDNVAVNALSPADELRAVVGAQEALAGLAVGDGRTVRSLHHVIDERWRIVRSDGTDVSFGAPRAVLRHDLSGRLDGRPARAAASVSGPDQTAPLSAPAVTQIARRVGRAAWAARVSVGPTPLPPGRPRIVLGHALAKGLAHEAIGHLCESDVDGSVLLRQGRLRLGERLARDTVAVVDGPLPGQYVQQPYSANGIPRQTVRLLDGGMLVAGLGDLFSAATAGVPITGACRSASFRDRPTPRMTNIRIVIADATPLPPAADPDDLSPDDVRAALSRLGLLDAGRPTLYLTGYRGGQAHPRRGDFVFGAEAAFDLGAGGAPLGPVSFTGLAERALAAIVAGIGPLCTDAIGTCGKDGSNVTSSGGSHALLVLDPDPDLIVSPSA